MGRLEGKVALITGAGSGIGRASALLFATQGAAVVAVDRSEAVRETVDRISKDGGRGIALIGDVSDEQNVSDFVNQAVKKFGQLDICFANAGISGEGQPPFFELTAAHWRELLDVNLIGVFLAIKHATKVMIPRQAGSIICTASVAGIRSGAGGAPYGASKAGVISLVAQAANYLTGTNIRVNAICPGIIETEMTKPIFDYADKRGTRHKIGQLNPLQRFGRADEVAQCALFLATDESSYINGQHIAVDGGLTSVIKLSNKYSAGGAH